VDYLYLSGDGIDSWLFTYGRLKGELEGLRTINGNANETSKATIERYDCFMKWTNMNTHFRAH
jgi:hypothetical protein